MNFRPIKFGPLLALLLPLALVVTGCAAPATADILPTESGLPPAQPTRISPTTPADTPQPSPTPTSPAGFDPQLLGNMSYDLDVFAQALPGSDGSVKLSDGHFEQPYQDSASRVVVDLMDYAAGDLNADGVEDAIALLAISTGGTGTFVHLAAVLQQGGQPVHTATFYLGDREVVRSMEIEDGVIKLQMVTHAPEDPLCCPSQPVTQEYILQDGMLVTPEQSQVLPLAHTAIQALKSGDMAELASLVHPQDGLRFSPYAYISPEHLVFSPDQLAGLMDDPTVYTWGAFDGSGEPIQMTFADYFSRFVYSKDFASAEQVELDRRMGFSNTLDNSHEFYPQSVVVEYFLPGENPDYGGLDWQSLRLVFQQVEGAWYLAGIIHDEWTI